MKILFIIFTSIRLQASTLHISVANNLLFNVYRRITSMAEDFNRTAKPFNPACKIFVFYTKASLR